MRAFDVVIVPDFTGGASLTFEARTLYFLASWMEFAGASRSFPVHVASIGEPPASVRTLAAKCGARISVHESLANTLGKFANKLRGFDVPAETDHIFLLDVDIFVLGDLAPLTELVPDGALGVTHNQGAIILPHMWDELYARLGQPTPSRTMHDFDYMIEDGEIAPEHALIPSFSSGALLVPRCSQLKDLWIEHLGVLAEFRDRWTPELAPKNLLVGDEPALATAIHKLQAEGQQVVFLPDRFHGKWRHLYRRSPKLDELAIFHMTSSFTVGKTLKERVSPVKATYERRLFGRYARRWLRHSDARARDTVRYLAPATTELLRLRSIFHKLYTDYVREVV